MVRYNTPFPTHQIFFLNIVFSGGTQRRFYFFHQSDDIKKNLPLVGKLLSPLR